MSISEEIEKSKTKGISSSLPPPLEEDVIGDDNFPVFDPKT